MSGVLAISGQQTQVPEGSRAFNLSIPMSSVSEDLENVFASASAWTVTAPVGAVGAAILPPVGNTVGLTLKGVVGDTGIALAPGYPSVLALTATSFVLASAGTITGAVQVSFF